MCSFFGEGEPASAAPSTGRPEKPRTIKKKEKRKKKKKKKKRVGSPADFSNNAALYQHNTCVMDVRICVSIRSSPFFFFFLLL